MPLHGTPGWHREHEGGGINVGVCLNHPPSDIMFATTCSDEISGDMVPTHAPRLYYVPIMAWHDF